MGQQDKNNSHKASAKVPKGPRRNVYGELLQLEGHIGNQGGLEMNGKPKPCPVNWGLGGNNGICDYGSCQYWDIVKKQCTHENANTAKKSQENADSNHSLQKRLCSDSEA